MSFSTRVRFIFIFIFGVVITLLLSYYFDPECGIDQCRYVDANDAELFYSVNEKISSTYFIFKIYTLAQESSYPYFIAFIINSFIVLILFTSVSEEYFNRIYLTYVSVPFFYLPGKEFFLFFSVSLIGYAMFCKPSKYRFYLCMLLALISILLARYQFALVFIALNYICKSNFDSNKFKGFIISLIVFLVLASLMTIYKGGADELSSLYTESSIPYAKEIRLYTSGYSMVSSAMRFFIYLIYGFFSPIVETIRLFRMDTVSPAILISFSSIFMAYYFLKDFGLKVYIIALISASIVLAPIFSFIHTRYLLPLMFYIYVYIRYSSK
ncbi:hypothetical protein [Vibrio cholerae]|uniref:hypothetical protein n=1 Tax=Vibrio cholerae TaxID=666 RepID=UPI003018B095